MKFVAFDTETTGLNCWLGAKVFAFSTCDEDENVEVWRLDGEDGRDPKDGMRALRSLIARARKREIGLVMANAKFDLRMTEHLLGERIAEGIAYEDVLLQSNIARSNHYSHKLKDLAWDYGGIPKDDETAIKPYKTFKNEDGEDYVDYSRVPAHLMHEYQRQDAIRTMLLHLFFRPKIAAEPRWEAIYQTELALVTTTLRMEERGVMLNRERCIQLSQKLKRDAERVLDECEAHMGRRINLGNDNKVRELLYGDLEFPVERLTDSGLPSVDKEALREMKMKHPHPVLDWVLQYKSWSRGSGTILKYLDFADENDVIHPDIRTCGAGTGRQSCSKPNLQNVAKEKNYMNPYPVPARQAFRPRPRYVNFHLDFKGLQFRLAVIRTGDERLLSLVRAGEDLHVVGIKLLVPDLWDSTPEEERGVLRGAGKNANFAKMFGAGVTKVTQTLGYSVTREDFRRYDELFGALDVSAKKMVAFAREHGYIDTLMGRRLWVPADKPYVATNYGIQGDEADVVKVAENRVHAYLEEHVPDAHLLIPIHDEIVLEWPRKILGEARRHLRVIRGMMVDFPHLAAPLDVEVEVATVDWSKKKGYAL